MSPLNLPILSDIRIETTNACGYRCVFCPREKMTRKIGSMSENDFSLVLNLSGNETEPAEVKLSLSADLSPVMKMMASKPISQFLEMLINEMENFKDWENTKE